MSRQRKLDERAIAEVRGIIARGGSQAEAAQAAGVSVRTVRRRAAQGGRPPRAPATGVEGALSGVEAALSGHRPAEVLAGWVDRIEVLASAAAERGEARSLALLLGCQEKLCKASAAISRADSPDANRMPSSAEMAIWSAEGRAKLLAHIERKRLGLPNEPLALEALEQMTPDAAKQAIGLASPMEATKLGAELTLRELGAQWDRLRGDVRAQPHSPERTRLLAEIARLDAQRPPGQRKRQPAAQAARQETAP